MEPGKRRFPGLSLDVFALWAQTEMLFTSGRAASSTLWTCRAWAEGAGLPREPRSDSEDIANILGGSQHLRESFVVYSQECTESSVRMKRRGRGRGSRLTLTPAEKGSHKEETREREVPLPTLVHGEGGLHLQVTPPWVAMSSAGAQAAAGGPAGRGPGGNSPPLRVTTGHGTSASPTLSLQAARSSGL